MLFCHKKSVIILETYRSPFISFKRRPINLQNFSKMETTWKVSILETYKSPFDRVSNKKVSICFVCICKKFLYFFDFRAMAALTIQRIFNVLDLAFQFKFESKKDAINFFEKFLLWVSSFELIKKKILGLYIMRSL